MNTYPIFGFCHKNSAGIWHKLEYLTPREEDIREWNDTLTYLTDAPPEDTAQAAKERLVALLAHAEQNERR